MKAKDLIAKLSDLDPDAELYTCTCSSTCSGDTTPHLRIYEAEHLFNHIVPQYMVRNMLLIQSVNEWELEP